MILRSIIIAAALAAAPAAAVNLVSNGSFESSAYIVSTEFGVDVFNVGVFQGVTDWTATLPGGISFYYIGANASTVGVVDRFNDPNDMLAASYPGASPDGGNFIGFDADFVGDAPPTFGPYNSPFVQTINNLTVGGTYQVDFFWAATQLQNRVGATTNRLEVSFGGTSQSTATVNVASQGFVGWTAESFRFTAANTSETLQFLAFGTPAGLPPFTLLDGVSLTAVPEPATWGLMIAGFGLVGAAARRRRAVVAA